MQKTKTFFEQELEKMTEKFPRKVVVGNAVYLPLSTTNRLKVEFSSPKVVEVYDCIRLTVLDKERGTIDSIKLNFMDILGKKPVENPNFPEGINPHVWVYKSEPAWYSYKLNAFDYAIIGEKIQSYADIFIHESTREFFVETPFGKLRAVAKHENDSAADYPGIFVELVVPNDDEMNILLACVEYDSSENDLMSSIYGNALLDEPTVIAHHKEIETFLPVFSREYLEEELRKGDTTEHGEPVAWVETYYGRNIEICAENDVSYYSVRLHCSPKEDDVNQFENTLGVMITRVTENYNMNELVDIVNQVVDFGKSFEPVEICNA